MRPRQRRPRPPIHAEAGDVGFRHRSAFTLLTATNAKTPKGEASGWFTAILYLMPHTSGGGATLCPYSTPACRDMCLSGAGLSGLPRAMGAKLRRTEAYNDKRMAFLQVLQGDVEILRDIADREGLKPALRLNGTSDVMWEFSPWDFASLGVQRYDYTKIPLAYRDPDPGYHLTFSVEGPESMGQAVRYLREGYSVAVVVPEHVKEALAGQAVPPGCGKGAFIDGDASDLRFLDPLGSVVLLKHKGHIVTSLSRPNVFDELQRAAEKEFA